METLAGGFRSLFDREAGPENHLAARWIFLRSLGLIYFAVFFALLFQVRGLIGVQGVLPAGEFLRELEHFGALRFWYAPSLLWVSSSDAMLMGVCWVGLVAAVLVVVNVVPRLGLVVCFVCFLSFIGVAQDFGEYQSDGMLLEAGFLALFVAPKGWMPGWGRRSLPVRAAMFLLLWEWFRIYFQSGVVKLESGDPTWRNLTAMYEYYQNGPLPTWVGWYLQHLPHWFHIATAGATLVMELVLVWMVFLRRRWRIVCFWLVTVWQAGVILTANYAFLNYLVLVLGFLLLDDGYLVRFVPRRWRSGLLNEGDSTLRHEGLRAGEVRAGFRLGMVRPMVAGVFLVWVGYVTTVEMMQMLWRGVPLPTGPVVALEPFRVANAYGLFANMTPHRYEIEFQGSEDGETWTPYLFRYKPQDVRVRPGIYAPYQPRFDWNLWFASLGSWQQSPIVPLTEERLLEGDGAVLGLFRGDPFGGRAPRYVRAVLWQYWFSAWEERRAGVWWRREMLGTFAPTMERLPDGRFGEVAAPELGGAPQS
jgi:hypothetical protein